MHWALGFLAAFLAGFFAGYSYRSYKLRRQLMSKKEYEELLSGYGLLKKPFAMNWFFEITLKAIIVAYVAAMVYFSVFE
ncbi:MAG: hypothetical protein QXO69_02960, partial [archaeon]